MTSSSSLSSLRSLFALWLLSLASVCEGSATVVNISESKGTWKFDCPDQPGNDGGGGWIFTQGSDCTTSGHGPGGKTIHGDWLPGYSVYGLLDGEAFFERLVSIDGNTTVDCQVTYPKGCFCDYDVPSGGCPIVERLPDVVIPKPTEFKWNVPSTASAGTDLEVKLQVRCSGEYEFCHEESHGSFRSYFQYTSFPPDAENYTYAMDAWGCKRSGTDDSAFNCVLACSPSCECTELQNDESIGSCTFMSQNGYDTEAPTMAPTTDTMSPTTSPTDATVSPVSSGPGSLTASWILTGLTVVLVSTTLN